MYLPSQKNFKEEQSNVNWPTEEDEVKSFIEVEKTENENPSARNSQAEGETKIEEEIEWDNMEEQTHNGEKPKQR